MQFLRTPKNIWESLSKEFSFTLDACASDKNHLLPKYYTEQNDCLKQDWTGEIVYLHPLFDMHIGKFVEKAFNSNCTTVMLLPASTHTRYFHKFIYHNPNAEIRFLEKPKQGFNFGNDDGTIAEIKKGKVGYIKPLMVVVFRNNGKKTKNKNGNKNESEELIEIREETKERLDKLGLPKNSYSRFLEILMDAYEEHKKCQKKKKAQK